MHTGCYDVLLPGMCILTLFIFQASFKYNSERCEVFVAKQLAARHPDRPEQCDRDVAPNPMQRFFDWHRLDNVESHRVAREDLPRFQTEDRRFRRGLPGNRDFHPYNRFFLPRPRR